MGETRTFCCTKCGYSAQVSGGNDVGMTFATTTVLCEGCRELMDVVTGEPENLVTSVEPRCPKRKRHRVRRWAHPDVCPRCGDSMAVDPNGREILWD